MPLKVNKMSRTKKGGKPVGYEFWSRRDNYPGDGKVAKENTKRKERARNRRMIDRVKNDPEDFDKRFAGE